MSVTEHRALSPASVACFVLTVSDTRTLETETSGRAIAELLVAAGRARAIITTGGTGIAKRDSTYEAVTALFHKRLDGFGELFRMLSYDDIGSAAMLSRATAGVASGCVIFMLPGSEAAVRLGTEKLIAPELGHIVRELTK